VHVDFSRLKARQVCRDLEDRWGLTVTANAGDTGVSGYTHAEKAIAAGGQPIRARLQQQVRVAASVSRDFAGMVTVLAGKGIVMEPRHVRPDGTVGGVAFGDTSYVNAAGSPVMFSGRALGRDLTLPKLQARWDAVAAAAALPVGQSLAVVDRLAAVVAGGGPGAEEVAAAAADHLAVVADLVEGDDAHGQLHRAARLAARLGTSTAGRAQVGSGPEVTLLRMATLGMWAGGKPKDHTRQLVVAAARLMESTARLRQADRRLANAHAAARSYQDVVRSARQLPLDSAAASGGPVTAVQRPGAARRGHGDQQRPPRQGEGRGR
jgi:hypothetical protein